MRKVLLALLVVVALHAPWRLAFLVGEAVIMKPALTRIDQGHDRYWDTLALQMRMDALGWEVEYQPEVSYMGRQAYGLTVRHENKIYIDGTLGWNQRFFILAHEAGHVMEPAWTSGDDSEVFAEMVAALVSRNGLREHARFLARTKVDTVALFLTAWPSVYRAAAVLEDR